MINHYNQLQLNLKIDCEKCSGLCCVALCYKKSDGFPASKESGVPCSHLKSDFRCEIHSNLIKQNMKGCLAYDCFGAGQKTTQHFINNINWKQDTAKNHDIFQTFQIIFQLNQMQWYLLDAFLLISDNDLKTKIEDFIYENEKITNSGINEILNFNVEDYRFKINKILKQVCNTFHYMIIKTSKRII